MKCPKCQYIREPKDSVVPDWQCPKCGVAYAKAQSALNKFVKIRLTSGAEIHINKIKLYDFALIKKTDALRSKAENNLAGYSSGIGFFGSLEYVATASVVAGVFENAISNELAKQGLNQLSEVALLSQRLRETAAFVQVSSIENIKYPDPAMWKAAVNDNLKRKEMRHIPSDYVFAEVEGKETAIFWNKIEQYEFI